MTEANRDKADRIERDIVQTQDDMSHTVDRLKERFTPQSLLNSILGDDRQGFDQIISLAKRNPYAVALIGVGAAWLATGKDAKLPAIGKRHGHETDADACHRSYVDHMTQLEMRENETPSQYQHRRDVARANYFMLERNHEEDETGFRKRIDDASEKLRSRTSALGDQAKAKQREMKARLSTTTESTKERAREAGDQAKQFYRDNALVGGLAAAAAGAMAASVIPASRIEQEKLGGVADAARTKLTEQKDKLVDQAEESIEKSGKKADPAF